MKVLIIRFSSIGDIVLTTPVIRALHEQLDAEVHYLTKPGYAGLLEHNPRVEKVISLKESFGETVKELKENGPYDFVVDLHNNLRSRRMRMALGSKSRSFKKLNARKWLLTTFKINTLPNKHIVERYMEAAVPLGVTSDDKGLEYYIPDKDEVEWSWLPDSYSSGFVVVSIGGQHATKRLPIDRLIELCSKVNGPTILLGGPEDKEVGDEIEAFFAKSEDAQKEKVLSDSLNQKTIVFNGCGKFNLNQSASLIKHSACVFTHDTGLMHIAAAFKKEIFSIWGNTVPEFGMYPYKTKFTIFQNQDLGCRPCSKIGYDKCPKGHFRCMKDVKLDFNLDY